MVGTSTIFSTSTTFSTTFSTIFSSIIVALFTAPVANDLAIFARVAGLIWLAAFSVRLIGERFAGAAISAWYGSILSSCTPATASCRAACLSCKSLSPLGLGLIEITLSSLSLLAKVPCTNFCKIFFGPNSTNTRAPASNIASS